MSNKHTSELLDEEHLVPFLSGFTASPEKLYGCLEFKSKAKLIPFIPLKSWSLIQFHL